MDHGLRKTAEPDSSDLAGLTSTLLFAACTTIGGYLPLIFCSHQVLAHLGQVLTIGTFGSTFGAFYAVPILLKWVTPKVRML